MVAEPSYSLELQELGLLHPYLTPARENLLFEYDPEGYWYPVRVCNMVLAYNPELYSLDEIPTSFYDFAYDKSVEGYISMGNLRRASTRYQCSPYEIGEYYEASAIRRSPLSRFWP